MYLRKVYTPDVDWDTPFRIVELERPRDDLSLASASVPDPACPRPSIQKTTICSHLAYGNVVLLGDAAHSMLASLGQGVQAALGKPVAFLVRYISRLELRPP